MVLFRKQTAVETQSVWQKKDQDGNLLTKVTYEYNAMGEMLKAFDAKQNSIVQFFTQDLSQVTCPEYQFNLFSKMYYTFENYIN